MSSQEMVSQGQAVVPPQDLVAENPSAMLKGLTLKNGWAVVEKINLSGETTGGQFFSLAYHVENEQGQRAFLKALDLNSALTQKTGEPVTKRLERVTAVHNFEVDLLERCRARGLNRVVRALDHGEANVPGSAIPVPYLIFELARGDTHRALAAMKTLDMVWVFNTLHHAAVGLQQLHGIGIAHKDFKPSNILFFEEGHAKLADLGRASIKGISGPHDGLALACQWHYAPPEHLYGFQSPSWECKHLAADLYQLGAYAYFLFTKVPLTSVIFWNVPSEFQPAAFSGAYSEALPILKYGLSEALLGLEKVTPKKISEILTETVRQLCDPDPLVRGHPAEHAARFGSKYGVRRFLSSFDRMRRIMETAV
jgi:serine/threonine protein kinase